MNKVLRKIDSLRAILRDSNLSTPRRVELLAEINRLTPTGPGISIKPRRLVYVQTAKTVMPVGTEIEGFTVGMQIWGVFTVWGIDGRTQVDDVKAVCCFYGDINIGIAAITSVGKIIFFMKFTDASGSFGNKEDGFPISAHHGVAFKKITIHRRRVLLHLCPTFSRSLRIENITPAQCSRVVTKYQEGIAA